MFRKHQHSFVVVSSLQFDEISFKYHEFAKKLLVSHCFTNYILVSEICNISRNFVNVGRQGGPADLSSPQGQSALEFLVTIYLQKSASIQPRTSPVNFAGPRGRTPRTPQGQSALD